MINLQVAREAFKQKHISDFGWKRRDRKIADALTNPNQCEEMLNLLRSNQIEDKTFQWVLWDSSRSN